ncbi:sugar phosphate nucleotidyltransferase [Alphaproteobacteria bacterium]|nr:sugar phosphate nucleotidyltransferase [Alphaproteobacteria bacterium]
MKNEITTTAVIFAGGKGTRLRSVVNDRPKPMAEICGRPFLEHLILYWLNQGIKHLVISTGYKGSYIKNYFGHEICGVPIDYVNEAHPMGTGGALLLVQSQLKMKEPFFLLNGDTFFEVDGSYLSRMASSANADWGLSLFKSLDSGRYHEVEVSSSGKFFMAQSLATLEGSKSYYWANGGVYWVNPRSLTPFEDLSTAMSLEDSLLTKCQNLGQKFCGVKFTGDFIDIGVPDDYAKAQKMERFNWTKEIVR